MRRLFRQAAVAGGWIAFVLATEHWRPWGDGIRLRYATDIVDYTRISRAAPGFPTTPIQAPHADRFPAPWLVGELHNITGVGLHAMYGVATGICLVATLVVLHASLQALRASVRVYALSLGAVIASAYPMRLLIDAPGMLIDALFVFCLALAAFAFVTGRLWLVVISLSVAEVGRQDALPLAVVAALLLLLHRRYGVALLAAACPAIVYVVAHRASQSFSDRSGRGIVGMTVGGDWSPHAFGVHMGRLLVVVAIPIALFALGYLRSRSRPLVDPLVLGVTVVAEAFVLAPDWSHAEPRLAGLALPALAIGAVPMLERAALTVRQTVLCCFGIAVASLHHLYSSAGINRSSEWGALVLLGCLCVVAPGVSARREVVADLRTE
jgi:hypothetical protein